MHIYAMLFTDSREYRLQMSRHASLLAQEQSRELDTIT